MVARGNEWGGGAGEPERVSEIMELLCVLVMVTVT